MEKRIKNNLCCSVPFLALVTLALIRIPTYISPSLNEMHKYLLLALTPVSIALYIKNHRAPSRALVVIMLFWAMMAVSTVMNHGSYILLFMASFSSILLCTTLENGFLVDKKRTLKVLSITTLTMVLINSMTMFVFYNSNPLQRGLYTDNTGDPNYYLLGQDNGTIFYAIPALILLTMYSLEKNHKVSKMTFLITFVIMLSYLWVFSGAGIVSTGMVLIIQAIINRKNIVEAIYRKVDIKKILIFSIALFVFLVLIRADNFLVDWTAQLLGKDSTFTGRTRIWDTVIGHVENSPFLGYGLQDDITKFSMLRVGGKAHNTFLQLCFNGGLSALIVYLISIKTTFTEKVKKEFLLQKVFLLCSIMLILVVGNFDFYIHHSFTFLPMILAGLYFQDKKSKERGGKNG